MDCTKALEQLADYLDEEARDELCRAIEEHLARCPDCQIKVDTLKKTIILFQADRATEIPVPEVATRKLARALDEEYARSASGSPRD